MKKYRKKTKTLHYQYAYYLESSFWFGFVTLFYGISTFVGYLMPKPFMKKKDNSGII